ncbi:uncharacterized protein LOC143449169 [Clavelina lepadiformis]|uniref:uncharacterized protein LOC143449169 n=1 Tax=Clavelina lepadiformis TaxID=159417 RepID=UPI004041148E
MSHTFFRISAVIVIFGLFIEDVRSKSIDVSLTECSCSQCENDTRNESCKTYCKKNCCARSLTFCMQFYKNWRSFFRCSRDYDYICALVDGRPTPFPNQCKLCEAMYRQNKKNEKENLNTKLPIQISTNECTSPKVTFERDVTCD